MSVKLPQVTSNCIGLPFCTTPMFADPTPLVVAMFGLGYRRHSAPNFSPITILTRSPALKLAFDSA